MPFSPSEDEEGRYDDDKLDALDHQQSPSTTESLSNQGATSPSSKGGGVTTLSNVSSLSASFVSRLGGVTSKPSLSTNHHDAASILGDLDVSVEPVGRQPGEDDLQDFSMPQNEHNKSQNSIGSNSNDQMGKRKGKERRSENWTPRASVVSQPMPVVTTPRVIPQGDFVDAATRLHLDDGESIRSGFQRKNGHDGTFC